VELAAAVVAQTTSDPLQRQQGKKKLRTGNAKGCAAAGYYSRFVGVLATIFTNYEPSILFSPFFAVFYLHSNPPA
jgi:hypothetical protein